MPSFPLPDIQGGDSDEQILCKLEHYVNTNRYYHSDPEFRKFLSNLLRNIETGLQQKQQQPRVHVPGAEKDQKLSEEEVSKANGENFARYNGLLSRVQQIKQTLGINDTAINVPSSPAAAAYSQGSQSPIYTSADSHAIQEQEPGHCAKYWYLYVMFALGIITGVIKGLNRSY